MRGLELTSGALRFRRDLPAPSPAPGECRVRVTRAGVCATDLALARGYMGFAGVPGHEFVGVALEGPLAGRRVVGEINAACGACDTCRRGLPRHCERRTVLGILGRAGAFAEELALPAANLLAVPDEVPDDAAVFVEPLAAALAIGEQVELARFERPVVVGDGRLGILCAHALAAAGLAPLVAGRHPERAGLLPPGCRHERGLFEEGGAAPRGAFDLVVEATGDPDVLRRVLPSARPRGTIVLKTTAERTTALDLAPLVVDELRLVGSRCGRFAPALDLLATGRVPVERMISARYPLERGPDAFRRAAEKDALKVLVDVDSGAGAAHNGPR